MKGARDLNRDQDLQEEVLQIRKVFAERARKPISDCFRITVCMRDK